MGVKGLQGFMDRYCPEACVTVHLRQVARNHSAKIQRDSRSTAPGPTLVVDGMACLRHWYSCEDWVCGGQWKEYVDLLKRWVEAFTSAGIRLVFFFDGVVEEKKRSVWVKRRHRVNRDIAKIFCHIKKYGEQPSGQLFCLPSGLATFTPFALRSLKHEVFCSVEEADYEIARYAHQNNCIGILGQDSDFIIHDSAPYFSLDKLQMKNLTTVMYDRHKLCQNVGLTSTQLPLLACLLGNDVVSEEKMQHIRSNATEAYKKSSPEPQSCAPQCQVIYAVSQFVSRLCSQEENTGLIPQSLGLSAHHRDLLKRGICSYYLSEQRLFELVGLTATPPAFEKHVSPEILKACREKHVAAEGFMLYSVVCVGTAECSNTLEDEEDGEMLPQALVYKLCRQRIYGLLLLLGQGNETVSTQGQSVDCLTIKEWFVFPGNSLKEPEIVHPVPVSLPCNQPSLDLLWFGSGPEISALRLTAFLSIFDCMELFNLYGVVEDSLLAAVCLVTYITLQVQSLSQEDVDAYLSQAVCLRLKTSQELQEIELPFLSSVAVQLGSLYVRGLSHMLGANSASGCPLPSAALMPWHSFDGRLFHSKYLLAHSSTPNPEVLVDGDPSCLSLFLQLRERLTEICINRGRFLQSRPQVLPPRFKATPVNLPRSRHTGCSPGGGEGWMGKGETAKGHRHGRGCMERAQERINWRDSGSRERVWACGGHRGGQRGVGGEQSYSFSPEWRDGRPQNMTFPQKQSRGRPYINRGRYQLAPRWSHPPAPGPTQH